MTSVGPYLSPAQAAARLTAAGLTVTEDTVRRWAKSGELASIRLPLGRYMIPASDVDALLNPSSTNKAAS